MTPDPSTVIQRDFSTVTQRDRSNAVHVSVHRLMALAHNTSGAPICSKINSNSPGGFARALSVGGGYIPTLGYLFIPWGDMAAVGESKYLRLELQTHCNTALGTPLRPVLTHMTTMIICNKM